MSRRKKWFVSHPSSASNMTPTFFSALDEFASKNDNKVELIFPHEDQERIHITKDSIEQADLIIVEVSMASTGSGIEMGWAHAKGIPVIAFHQGASTMSPSIQFVATAIHSYLTPQHVTDVLATLLN